MNKLTTDIYEYEDDYCDLNPEKICDNCGKCLESENSYNSIKITKIIMDESE